MELELSAGDFDQRYRDTVFKIKVDGKEMIYSHQYVEHADDGNICFTGQVISPSIQWMSARFEVSEVESDFGFPRMGAINCPDTVGYFTRYALRQWKRGYSQRSDVVTVSYFDGDRLMHTGKHTPSVLAAKTVQSVFYPTKYTAQEAITTIIEGKRVGTAFSPNFYYIARANFPKITLYYKDFLVGEVGENGETLLYSYAAQLYEELIESVNVTII